MYYNKTMFEEAGAPLPTAEWTWDDLIASCKIILEQTGNFCVPNSAPTWWAVYVPWIVGYGGTLLAEDGRTVTLNSPESLAGLSALVGLWTEHGIGQPLDFDAGGDCFFVGKCALSFTIAGQMSALRALDPQPFVWDVEVIPSHPNGKVTGMGTYGFAISANAQDPALAWDFVKNLLAPETQKAIAMSYAGTPLLNSLAEDPDILNREALSCQPTSPVNAAASTPVKSSSLSTMPLMPRCVVTNRWKAPLASLPRKFNSAWTKPSSKPPHPARLCK
jgi:multiple sugar transport system substrate-binding protein